MPNFPLQTFPLYSIYILTVSGQFYGAKIVCVCCVCVCVCVYVCVCAREVNLLSEFYYTYVASYLHLYHVMNLTILLY